MAENFKYGFIFQTNPAENKYYWFVSQTTMNKRVQNGEKMHIVDEVLNIVKEDCFILVKYDDNKDKKTAIPVAYFPTDYFGSRHPLSVKDMDVMDKYHHEICNVNNPQINSNIIMPKDYVPKEKKDVTNQTTGESTWPPESIKMTKNGVSVLDANGKERLCFEGYSLIKDLYEDYDDSYELGILKIDKIDKMDVLEIYDHYSDVEFKNKDQLPVPITSIDKNAIDKNVVKIVTNGLVNTSNQTIFTNNCIYSVLFKQRNDTDKQEIIFLTKCKNNKVRAILCDKEKETIIFAWDSDPNKGALNIQAHKPDDNTTYENDERYYNQLLKECREKGYSAEELSKIDAALKFIKNSKKYNKKERSKLIEICMDVKYANKSNASVTNADINDYIDALNILQGYEEDKVKIAELIHKKANFLFKKASRKEEAAEYIDEYNNHFERCDNKQKNTLRSRTSHDSIRGMKVEWDNLRKCKQQLDSIFKESDIENCLTKILALQNTSFKLFKGYTDKLEGKIRIKNREDFINSLNSEIKLLNAKDVEDIEIDTEESTAANTIENVGADFISYANNQKDNIILNHPGEIDIFNVLDNEDYKSLESFNELNEFYNSKLLLIKKIVGSSENNSLTQEEKDIFVLYYLKLLNAYTSIFKYKEPKMEVDNSEGILYRYDNKNMYAFYIKNDKPATNQDALDVKLTISEGQSKLNENDEIPSIGIVPSGNKLVQISVPVQSSLEKINSFKLNISMAYSYMAKLKADKNSPLPNYEVTNILAPVSETTIEGISKELVEKHPITTQRIGQFPFDGNLKQLDDGQRRILKNREKLIKEVFEAITNANDNTLSFGKWVMLYGQWRVGKTVILNSIADKLSNEYKEAIVVPISFKGGNDTTSKPYENKIAADLYNKLWLTIQRAYKKLCKEDSESELALTYKKYSDILEELCVDYRWVDEAGKSLKNIDKKTISWDQFCRFISEFGSELSDVSSKSRIVFLFDEFTDIYQALIHEYMVSTEAFFTTWNSLVGEAENIICISAGGENSVSFMEKYAINTLQKLTSEIQVGYLPKDAVETYLHYVLCETEKEYAKEGDYIVGAENSYFVPGISEDAIDRIYELTQGNAFLLTHFATWLINCLKKENYAVLSTYVVEDVLRREFEIKDGQAEATSKRNSRIGKLFDSLYNPFHEDENAIEGEHVKEDNKKILQTIVSNADKNTHFCRINLLRDILSDSMECFEERFKSLIDREILLIVNGQVKVAIDLYYEIAHE